MNPDRSETKVEVGSPPQSATALMTPHPQPSPSTQQVVTPPSQSSPITPSTVTEHSIPDLKLIYFNKTDSDIKTPASVPLSNGVGSKYGGTSSNSIAYVGTLIKQGRDSTHGQKVLLTPVIKDGTRFILPRTAPQRPTSATSATSATSTSSHIYVSQPQPRRSFLIHNSNLSSKDKISKAMVESGTVVPKVLPPPKVPLVVCSPSTHDVTLTSVVKPIGPTTVKDPPPSPSILLPSAESGVTLTNSSPVLRQSQDVAQLDVTLTSVVNSTSSRDIPPLAPLAPSTSPHKSFSSIPDIDGDVELISDGEMPRPINSSFLKLQHSSLPLVATMPSAHKKSLGEHSLIISSNNNINNQPEETGKNKSVMELGKCDDKRIDDEHKAKTMMDINDDTEPDSTSEDISLSESKQTDNFDSPTLQIAGETLTAQSEKQLECHSSTQTNKAAPTQIKLVDTIKLKSLPPSRNYVGIIPNDNNSDIVSGKPSSTVYFKDGAKTVVFSSLVKDLNPFKEKEANEEGKEFDKEAVIGVKEVYPPHKQMQKSFPLRVSQALVPSPLPVTTGEPAVSLNMTKVHVVSGSQKPSNLHIKELSKDSAMMERSRKRKGTPLLRDCFKKTIAVKRLEPLPGAAAVDPLQVIEWDPVSSVGNMPGSDIKFVVNSYGALQVYEGDGIKNNSTKKVGGVDVVYCAGETSSKDDIGMCIECECYGLIGEFLEERFCNMICREHYETRKALYQKRSLAAIKASTNKKRRLLEMALNKTHSPDSKEDKLPTDKKILLPFHKAILPKPVAEPKPTTETKTVKMPKPEPKKIIKPIEIKTKAPKSIAVEPTIILTKPPVETKSVPTPKILIEPVQVIDAKLATKSNDTSSTSAPPSPPPLIDNTPSKPPSSVAASLTKIVKPHPKLVILPEPKVELPPHVKTPEDKKITKEKPVVTPTTAYATTSISTSTFDLVSEEEGNGGSSEFDWWEYLNHMRSHPAWVRLFKDPFPTHPNLFKVGYRLEAIDPHKPSLFCAVSVAQIKGYRLKLHFDGYAKTHDFWLNVDSPNIFPCGFCSSHGIDLEPPWGFSKGTFSWSLYLANVKAKPAPPKCFIHKQMDSGEPNLFKVGMKLEAVDKKNSYLVCVATVAAVVDHRILVHFDSWDELYDYWTEYYSPNIHPVGWCKQNNHVLTPPNGHKRKNFSWKRYLVETGSETAPDCAFMVRPPIRFKKGSKLEAVDPRSPHLLRVATIKQVLPYQVHIVFDGFPDHFGFWFDDDSPDLHPVGWGMRTGHPLSPPPKPNTVRRCCTAGCFGDGNTTTADVESHSVVAECPYSMDNLEEENHLPDRFSNKAQQKSTGKSYQDYVGARKEPCQIQRSRKSREDNGNGTQSSEPPTLAVQPKILQVQEYQSGSPLTSPVPPPTNNTTQAVPLQPSLSPPLPNIGNNNPLHGECEVKEEVLTAACDKFLCKSLSLMTSPESADPEQLLTWDSRRVTIFVESVLHRATNAFYNNKVDGEGLLMLTEEDLCKRLCFTQTEASTIHTNLLTLKNKFI